MKAKVIDNGNPEYGELINVNGHQIQYGGANGDGYCYAHQSFDCLDNLTDEEKEAVKNAR